MRLVAAGTRRLGLLLLAALALGAPAARAAEVPALTGRVVDQAGVLGASLDRLASTLAEYEARTTTQIVVLTLPTLGGEPVESFSTRAFNTWGLGQKGRNNGVLVVVVPGDRQMRIEVGNGLEERLTSAAVAGVIQDVMAPSFRGGDFGGGVERGVQELIAMLERKIPAAEQQAPAALATQDEPSLAWRAFEAFRDFLDALFLLLFPLAVVALPVAVYCVLGERRLTWYLYAAGSAAWAAVAVVVGNVETRWALGVYVAVVPIGKLIKRYTSLFDSDGYIAQIWRAFDGGESRSSRSWSSRSWSSRSSSSFGSSSSSRSGFSSSSRSSFSGGGGRSTGGGASGGW